MDPTQMLKDALALLNREFPDARLVEARLEFRLGERHGETHGSARDWSEMHWTAQVDNDSAHCCGDSLEPALAELRAGLARKAQIPERAERIAAILREVPDEAFVRHEVMDTVQRLLEQERRGGCK